MESSRRLLVLFAFVYSAVAVPLTRREKCARHCVESSRFQFTPGTTYTYDYETLTTTNVKGMSDEQTQLQMKAQVDIEVLDKCDLSLRLRGVTLKQSDPHNPDYLMPIKGGRDFAFSAQRYILRFSYQDGVVQELCPDEEAPAWLTNIQRGVLSAFQNSMVNLEGNERLIETDVGGKCSVEYQSLGRSWRGTLTIRKMKDLNTCTDRQSADTSFQGAPFTHGSAVQSMPLLKGHQECEQIIGSGIIQSSTCTETHVLRPFSKGTGGATTSVHQKLTYVTATQQKFTGNDYRPTRENLLFDHGKDKVSSADDGEEAERALAKLCESSINDISISVPGMFASFVYRMKKLDYQTFSTIYKKVETICPNNPRAKKFFLDAVPVVSTLGSIKFMKEMITKREVDDSEISFWFSSMSFISEPSIEMIATLAPLMDGSNDQAFFGISSLVHTFCTKNDCGDVEDVKYIVQQLASNLGENCYNPDVKKILLTLKAIGNIGIPFGREKIIERCAMNPQLETEVRIAAIQAFRRFSCHVSRETFLKMYSNYNEGSEMRIAAYLSAISCPETEVLQVIKNTLEKEQVNQVGSFVWTHLRALAKSQHPDRQDIKDILSTLYLMNKYESDIRKFSSAREATFFLESINSGFHVDTHLVYPTHSFLPHSATFNLTLDIFGHNCNLLQLDGRLEGMERVLERLFGPSGLFPQKDVATLLRNKRSIADNKIERMDNEFNVKSNFDKKAYGSLDVKIFGNTLWFSQFQEDEQGDTSVSLMDLISDLAQNREKEFSRSLMFLDTNYAIPMATGLPLRLSLNGTATVGLKLGGKFNVRSFENIDVIANMEPSGAVELAGLLTVDVGGVARTGLRIAATIHSSTVLDTKIEVRNGQVAKAQLNMPREKIEIVDVQSKIYLVYGSDEREQSGLRDNSYHFDSCMGDATRKMLGVELCTSVALPKGRRNSPMYPMNGAASFALFIKKTDPALTAYTFDAAWESKTLNGKSIRNGVISLNTPKSTIDREVTLQFQLNEADNIYTFDFKSPVKKIALKAKYANGKAMKKLDLSATVDEKHTFSARTELRTTSEEGGVSFFPSLEIQIPSRTLLAMEGSAHLRHGLKYGGQLTIKELTERPIVMKGNLDIMKRDRYEGEISLSSFAIDTTTKALLQMSDTMVFKMNTDYRIMDSKQYRIDVNGKVRDLSANALRKYTGLLNMQATAFPEWDTSISMETMTTTGHIENSLSMSIGDGTRSRVHTINLQEIIRYKGGWMDNSGEITVKFSYPEKRINYSFGMKHENTDRSMKNEMKIQYMPSKEIINIMSFNLHEKNSRHFSGDVQLSYPGRRTKLSADLRENSPRDYRAQVNVQWQEGKTVAVVSHYKNKGDDNTNFKHEIDTEIAFSNRQPINFIASFGAQRGHYAGLAEVNFGLDKYRINADYTKGEGINHRLSGEILLGSELYVGNALMQHSNDKGTLNVEVKFPGRRRIFAKVDVKNSDSFKTMSIESMWDADVDQSKRFGLDCEARLKKNGYDGRFVMQIKRRTIRGQVLTTREGHWHGNYLKSLHKAELEWSPKEKVTVVLNTDMLTERNRHQVSSSLSTVTPYSGYETVTVSVKHSTENQQWSSEASTTWGTNKLAMFTDGRYSFRDNTARIEVTAKCVTPFRQYESLTFNATHFQNAMEFSNKMLLQWNDNQKIATDLYHYDMSSGFKCGMKLTSPFTIASDVATELTHSYNSGGYKTNGMVQWAPRQKINVAVDLRHVFNGRRRSCSASLVMSSPFKNYETLSSKMVYGNDGTTFNSDFEVHKQNLKIVTGGVTGSYQNSYYNKNLDTKVYFTSPIRKLENVQISTLFQSTSDTYKFNIDAQSPSQFSTSLNSEGKIMSLRDMEINVVLSGDLPSDRIVKPFSFDFVHKLQYSNLRTTFDMTYGQKQGTVLLTAMSKPGYKSQDIEGSLSIKTPFRGYEEIKVDATHKQKDWEFMTRLEGNKNRENILLVHSMNIKDMLNVEGSLHLTSTIPKFRDIKLTLAQINNPGYFAHNTKVQWGKNKDISLNAQFQSKLSTKELVINLNTPFENVKSFALSTELQQSHTEYKTRLTTHWNGKEKLSVETTFANYRLEKCEANVRVNSNFGKNRVYQFVGKYDVTNPQKTVGMTFSWNHGNDETISFKGNMLMNKHTPKFDVELTTPFMDFEKINLIGLAENRPSNKHVLLTYYRNMRKVVASVKFASSKDGAQYEASFTSPFQNAESLSFFAKHQFDNGELTGNVDVQWAPEKKVTFVVDSSINDRQVEGKLLFTTPFDSYRTLSMNVNGDISKRKHIATVSMSLNNDKTISLSADCEVKRHKEGTFNIQFRSPFRNIRDVRITSGYKTDSRRFNTKMEVNIENQSKYNHEINYDKDGKLTVTLNTPYRPLRSVELIAIMTNVESHRGIDSTLKVEDKTMIFSTFYKTGSKNSNELSLKIRMPINDEMFSVDGSFSNNGYTVMDSSLIIVTPFDAMRNLEVSSSFRNTQEAYETKFKFALNPTKSLTVSAQVSKDTSQPITASVIIDAPFTKFRSLTVTATTDLESTAEISMTTRRSKHSVSLMFKNQNMDMTGEITVRSPLLTTETAKLLMNGNFGDYRQMRFELLAEVSGEQHGFLATFQKQRLNYEFEARLTSPRISGNKAELKSTYIERRQKRTMDTILLYSGSNHQLKATYETDDRQTSGSVLVESSFLPMSFVKCNAKYVNGNNRDLELVGTIEVPDAKHEVVTSIKNYNSEKFFQLKLQSPMMKSREFSLTSTLKNEKLDAVDGVITITYAGEEFRTAINMKRNEWETIEGFLTINTPFDQMRMLRIDTGFMNDGYRNIEGNIQIKSSNQNYPSLGLSAKVSRSEGSEDLSLMFRLPNVKYHTIKVLGNLHYNKMLTSSDARVTLSLPSTRYSTYGHYELAETKLSVDFELEQNEDKWTLVSQFENQPNFKGASVVFKHPNRETYEASTSVHTEGYRHRISMYYNDPQQRVFRMNSTINYMSVSNMNIVMEATTSMAAYRHVEIKMKLQKRGYDMLFADVEGTINNRKSYLNLIHKANNSNYECSLKLGSPFHILKEFEISTSKGRNGRERNLEVSYNRQRRMKLDMTTFGQTATFIMDLPPVPLTITAKFKPRDHGNEIAIKSNYPTRTMSFNSIYHNAPGSFAHEAAIVWDEAEQKSLSYSTKLTEIVKGQTLGKDFILRLNFPRRSMEVRSKLARSNRVQSGGVDIFWDAARDMKKNMTIGVEHQNLSTREMLSHKLQITMTHPNLATDLVQSNYLVMSPTEFRTKSELRYSRNNDHDFVVELTANDHSRHKKDGHYKTELNVRHLVSHLDFKMTGEMTNNEEEFLTHLRVNSADRSGQQTVREIRAKILKLRQQIDIMMRSSENKMTMLGKMIQRGSDLTMSLDHSINDQRSMQSHMKYNRHTKSLDINVTATEGRGIRLRAAFPDDSVSVRLSHNNDVSTVTDASLFVGLEKSRIFKSRVNWRPGMWRDFRIATGDALRGLSYSVSKGIEELSTEMRSEWTPKLQAAVRTFDDQISPFKREMKREFTAAMKDVQMAKDTLKLMYEENDFYLRDIVRCSVKCFNTFKTLCASVEMLVDVLTNVVMETMEELYDTITIAYEDFMVYLRNMYKEWKVTTEKYVHHAIKTMTHGWRSVCKSMTRYIKRVTKSMVAITSAIGNRMESWLRAYTPCIIDMYYSAKLTADNIREKMQRLCDTVTTTVVGHPLYVAFDKYWTQIIATIRAFEVSDWTSSLQSRVLFLGEQAGSFINRLSDGQLLDIIRNRIPVDYVTDVAKVTLRKGVDLYQALGMNNLMNNLLGYGMDQMKEVLLSSGHEMLQEFYQLKSGAKYDFDTKNGQFLFEYNLPTSSNSIYDVFNFAKYSEYQKLVEMKNTLVAKYYEDFCIWDMYYRIKNSFRPRNWMPPFPAHAMMAGNQHFVTFDKFAFDFASECSYLLSRDFVDGNFTVVANYKRDGSRVVRKSLTVMSESNKLDIVHDYKVTLNDVKVELPIKIENTVVIREGSTIRVENEAKGFVVLCNFIHDVCTVGMSGFYFGKTGGLFGTYDNEPKLDLMTSDMNLATDIETFASSWEVGTPNCRRTTNMATLPGNDRRVQDECRALFEKSSSKFRACFKQVDPESFLRMCISDLSAVDESQFDSAICVSAAAYFTECKIEGVELKMPVSCVRCETENGPPLFEGNVMKFYHDQPARSADIVFIVEEKECNAKNYKFLEKLSHSIEDNFQQQGFQDIRYRVVGFGGDNIHTDPHIHTIEGNEYGSIRSVESAFQSLQVGDGPANILEALRFAAALNYHPGSVKSFVLLKCSTCEPDENRVAYGEVLRTLLDAEITLHVLMEQKYEMRIAKNSKAKKVIGLDKNFAYTLKDIKDSNLLGDGDLLVQLKMPKDICLPLALEVNGSTFDSQYLTDTKRNTYKKFMDVMARRMLQSAKQRSEWTMCCECIANSEGIGKTTCQKCVPALGENMITGYSSSFYAPSTRDEMNPESKTKVRRTRERKRGSH